MNTEEKIYSLMAQAEDMQAHAEKLQNGADKTFAGLPLAVEQAGQKIRATGLLGALFVLAVGVVVAAVAVAGIWWGTSLLRDEAAALRSEIVQMKETVALLEGKTWGIALNVFTDGTRGIVLPKGVKYKRHGKIEGGQHAGREGIVITN